MTHRFRPAAVAALILAVVVADPLLAQGASKADAKAAASAPTPAPLAPSAADEEASARRDGVAAIVNDTIISEYDVRQRLALFYATTGAPRTADSEKTNRELVLNQLETDRIKFLEAQKNGISVSSADVDKALERIRGQSNMSEAQMTEILARAGASMGTFRQQIAVQIAWEKVVQQKYGDQIVVSDDAVNAELARLKQGSDKPFFLVSEIFMAVDAPEQDDKVHKAIDNIEAQLRTGRASFPALAQQSSQSPTAAQGGDLGWTQESQLAPELANALAQLHVGEITQPIRSVGGYYILALRGRQEPAGTKVPTANQNQLPVNKVPLARLTLAIGPSPSKALLEQATKAAQQISSHIEGCEHLREMVADMRGVLYSPPGETQYGDLARDVQQRIQQTPAGGMVAPFLSPAGMELIVRCDKAPPRITAYHIPTRDEVTNRIAGDLMDVYARRYLRDLKRDAQIVLPGETLKAARHESDVTSD